MDVIDMVSAMKRNGGEIHIYYEHMVDHPEVLRNDGLLLEGPVHQAVDVGVDCNKVDVMGE